jgi:hypothetical protein
MLSVVTLVEKTLTAFGAAILKNLKISKKVPQYRKLEFIFYNFKKYSGKKRGIFLDGIFLDEIFLDEIFFIGIFFENKEFDAEKHVGFSQDV